jgi:hypothetical protein
MGKLTLAVSFHGPFAFDFQKESVIIYAPLCDGHFASAQTDLEEIGLAVEAPKSTYRYALHQKASVAPNVRITSVYNPDQILVVDTARRKAKAPEVSDCRFLLQVPRPDQVVGLVADPISIVEYDLPNPGDGAPARKATSMRFNYHDIDDTNVWELMQVSDMQTVVLRLPIKAVPPADYVQLTFRYNSGTPDQGHKDAAGCFQEMRNLFPPLGAWRVKFDQSLLLNHLSDCHAAQIMFVQYDEMKSWKNGANSKS